MSSAMQKDVPCLWQRFPVTGHEANGLMNLSLVQGGTAIVTDEDAFSDKEARPSEAVDKLERPSQAVDKVARPSEAVEKVERPASERRGTIRLGEAGDLPPQYSFEQLAGGCATIQIVFEGREYCLRRTRAGKLVLNK